jgi:hypothetical protein
MSIIWLDLFIWRWRWRHSVYIFTCRSWWRFNWIILSLIHSQMTTVHLMMILLFIWLLFIFFLFWLVWWRRNTFSWTNSWRFIIMMIRLFLLMLGYFNIFFHSTWRWRWYSCWLWLYHRWRNLMGFIFLRIWRHMIKSLILLILL